MRYLTSWRTGRPGSTFHSREFSESWAGRRGTSVRQLDSQVAAILQARHDNPFAFLGMHHCGDGICVRAMLPDAQQMAVVDSATGNIAAEGVRVHPDGFFVATIVDRR